MTKPMRVVVIGLSLSSSWGNGHATTYRALLRGLARRGHEVSFLERDQPWYAEHRDLAEPDFCALHLYRDLRDLERFQPAIASADAVIVGSYVADGVAIGEWIQSLRTGVTAFYDIDTPVTLAKLENRDYEYLSPAVIPGYDPYLSFTGGPALRVLERRYGAPAPRVLYCSVDEALYPPLRLAPHFELGYLGTYSPDRQPALERLLLEPARQAPDLRFVVAGAQFPDGLDWPDNVTRLSHVAPHDHPEFYAQCRFTLNVTRASMVRAGFSPSVRLFEAAACSTPIISDPWPGLETLFRPGKEILLAETTQSVLRFLRGISDRDRRGVGDAARTRILAAHTSRHRARELEDHLLEAMERRRIARRFQTTSVSRPRPEAGRGTKVAVPS